MNSLKKFLNSLFVLLLMAYPVSAAESMHDVQIYMQPQIMNDMTGEIVVDVNMRNFGISVPDYKGAMCGVSFTFEYDHTIFDIQKDENGNVVVKVDEGTLIKSTTDIDVKVSDNAVRFSFLDSTLNDNLIDKDGTLCRFILVAKNHLTLWNSSHFYPIRFVPGSVGMVTYHLPSYSVGNHLDIVAFDSKVGAYNIPINYLTPYVDKKVEFKEGSAQYTSNGNVIDIDAVPYIKDGHLMLPVRYLSEGIGMTVDWDSKSMTAKAYADFRNLAISIKHQEPIIYINSSVYTPSVAPDEKNGRIYIPADVITELYPNAAITQNTEGATIYIP